MRGTHIPLFFFADLTYLKHLSYIQNLDCDEDGTGVSAFDTSRLGLWLSDLLDGSIVLLYLVPNYFLMPYLNINNNKINPSITSI